jgi:probable DNA repair protein
VFLALVAGLGWPGERTLDSEDYQTWKRWRELVSELSQLDAVLGPIAYHDALAWLARLSADTLFQPESEDVPLQVLGVLESAGLSFDHLFVTGLHDEALPAGARPSPLLPAALQRVHGVPHASAEWELGFAHRMMALWQGAAPEVVFSHPSRDGERELGPSPLLAEMAQALAPAPRASRYPEAISGAARLERLVDGTAPELPPGQEVAGGTTVFRDQAACPFRAFAVHRLGAVALDEGRPGLDPRERGTLLHEAARYLWGEIGSQERLAALSEVEARRAVASAVDLALAQMRRRRPDALTDAFLELERTRLCALLPRLLEIEKQRAPFRVVQREEPYPLETAGLRMQVRPDRIDLLDTGGSVILDYKSGQASARDWLGQRPEEPQLPIYAIELRSDVAAVSFVTLRPERVAFEGLARSTGLLPGVDEVEASKVKNEIPDWTALLESWRSMRDTLAAEFLGGRAAVAPKDPKHTCRYCAVRPFCRMVELFTDRSSGEEDGDE